MSKEKDEQVIKALESQDILIFKSITNVNHNPHPYTIGPKHIVFASDRYGGMLGEDAIKEGEKQGKCKCAHPQCNTPYESHTSDQVCFLQFTRDTTGDEVNVVLKKLVDDLGPKFVDGFAFVETKEKFRVT